MSKTGRDLLYVIRAKNYVFDENFDDEIDSLAEIYARQLYNYTLHYYFKPYEDDIHTKILLYELCKNKDDKIITCHDVRQYLLDLSLYFLDLIAESTCEYSRLDLSKYIYKGMNEDDFEDIYYREFNDFLDIYAQEDEYEEHMQDVVAEKAATVKE